MTTKHAVIYARVSTDEQAKKGYSLPTQLEACRKYAIDQGYSVPSDAYEIIDDYSGMKLRRPGLDKVRELLERKQAVAVIVYSSDRLTRNLAHLLLLREEWQRAGVELHYVNRGKSSDNPESRMTENMEGVFNDYWREKILEASMRGKRAKAKNGKWVGGGQTPYGYARMGERAEARLVVCEPEARIVRQIFEWYTGADSTKPLSCNEIARRLTAAGVPTPSRGKKGRNWFRDTVNCVLSNSAYIGEFKYAGHITVFSDLALIDRMMWEIAQKRRERNKAFAKRNRKRDYLLPGHIRCACEAAMVGVTRSPERKKSRTKSYAYYVCNSQWSHRHVSKCHESTVPMSEADEKVWTWLYNLLSDEEQLRHGIRRMTERNEVELSPKRERLKILNELIAQTEAKIERWLSDFGDESDEFIRETVQDKVKQTGRVRDELIVEQKVLAKELAQSALTPEEEERMLAMTAEIRAGMIDADYETKRYYFDRLDVRAQLRRDDSGRWLDCTCAVPGWEFTVALEDQLGPNKKGSYGRGRPSSHPRI